MKKYILNFVYISIIAVTAVACKKEEETHDEDEHTEVGTPLITITSFNDGDTIQPGAEFHMSGTIVSTSEMHGYEIILHNHATMQDVFNVSEHSHATSYSVHEHWTNNVADTSTVMFTLNAVKDHSGGITTKTLHVVCLP